MSLKIPYAATAYGLFKFIKHQSTSDLDIATHFFRPRNEIAPIYTHFFSTKGNARVKNLARCANNELRQELLQHFDVLGISRWLKLMTEKSSSRKMRRKGKWP